MNLLPAKATNCYFMHSFHYLTAHNNKQRQGISTEEFLPLRKKAKNMKFHKLAHIHSQLIFQFHFSQFLSFRGGMMMLGISSQPRNQTETKTLKQKREKMLRKLKT